MFRPGYLLWDACCPIFWHIMLFFEGLHWTPDLMSKTLAQQGWNRKTLVLLAGQQIKIGEYHHPKPSMLHEGIWLTCLMELFQCHMASRMLYTWVTLQQDWDREGQGKSPDFYQTTRPKSSPKKMLMDYIIRVTDSHVSWPWNVDNTSGR